VPAIAVWLACDVSPAGHGWTGRRDLMRLCVSTRGGSTSVVGDEMGMDDVGEVPFQAPAGLLRGLGLSEFASVVGLPGAGVADLADGDQVQGGVELAVAAPGSADGGARRRWRPPPGRYRVAGEVVAVREAGDVAGVAQQLGRQHRADPTPG
jgi:hypothetical protein